MMTMTTWRFLIVKQDPHLHVESRPKWAECGVPAQVDRPSEAAARQPRKAYNFEQATQAIVINYVTIVAAAVAVVVTTNKNIHIKPNTYIHVYAVSLMCYVFVVCLLVYFKKYI